MPHGAGPRQALRAALVAALVLLLLVVLWGYRIIGLEFLRSEGIAPSASLPTTLVTGGLGFIGSHVVEELLAAGHRVLVYDDESNGHNFQRSAVHVRGDVRVVRDFRELDRLDAGVDYLVHLAAAISVAESMANPEKYNSTNVRGSAHVFFWALAHGVKHVVAASSAAVYGDPPPSSMPVGEEVPYGGLSPYAWSKWRMERIMESLSREHGFCCTALRFFNVYGPRQDPKNPYSGVISLFMDDARSNRDLRVSGDGGQTRDFVYVKDIAHAIVTAMLTRRCEFDVFNVCTGVETSIKELAHEVVGTFASRSKVVNGPPRTGDINRSVCNPRKLNARLGFRAKTTVAEGLAHTRDWLLSSR